MNERTVRLQVNNFNVDGNIMIQVSGDIDGLTAYFEQVDNIQLGNPIVKRGMEDSPEYAQNLALLELKLVLTAIQNFKGWNVEIEQLQFGAGDERVMDMLDGLISDLKGYCSMANYVPKTEFLTWSAQKAFDKLRSGIDSMRDVHLVQPAQIKDPSWNFDDTVVPYEDDGDEV